MSSVFVVSGKRGCKTVGIFLFLFSCCWGGSIEAAWSTPVTISSGYSDQVSVAVDRNGNANAIWIGFDGVNYVVQTSKRASGGSWSSPLTLSDSLGNAQTPSICIDYSGNVVATWSQYDGTYSMIQAARVPFGGAWSTPVNISSSGTNSDSCVLEIDSRGNVGNAVAVWHRYNGSNFVIQSATLSSGGSWSSPVDVSASGDDALAPAATVDPSGNALVAYVRYDGTNFNVFSSGLLYLQLWGPNFLLSSPNQPNYGPVVRTDTSGNATVLWSQFNGSNYVIKTSSSLLGAAWSIPVTLSASGQNAYLSDFAIDSLGNIRAIWVRFNGSNYILQGSNRSILGFWSSPVNISATGQDVGWMKIAMDPQGNCVAIWDVFDGVNSKVQAARLPKNGSWTTPVDVSSAGQSAYSPSIGVDSAGNSVAVWLESDGGEYVVKGATLPFGG